MSKQSHQKHEHKQAHKHHSEAQDVQPHEDYHAGVFGDVIIVLLILGLGLFFILPFYGLLPNPGNIVIILIFFLIIGGFIWLLLRRNKRRKGKL